MINGKRALAACVAAWFVTMAGLYLAIGQPIGQATLSGNECWNTGQGPGGPSTGFVCTNLMRNSTANVIASSVAGSFTISGTAAQASLADGGNLIITAQPAAATITLPPNPFPDGGIVGICNGTNSAFATNVVTVAANTNQTLVPTGASITLTTLAAATCVRYQFNLATTSWYKVQ